MFPALSLCVPPSSITLFHTSMLWLHCSLCLKWPHTLLANIYSTSKTCSNNPTSVRPFLSCITYFLHPGGLSLPFINTWPMCLLLDLLSCSVMYSNSLDAHLTPILDCALPEGRTVYFLSTSWDPEQCLVHTRHIINGHWTTLRYMETFT